MLAESLLVWIKNAKLVQSETRQRRNAPRDETGPLGSRQESNTDLKCLSLLFFKVLFYQLP